MLRVKCDSICRSTMNVPVTNKHLLLQHLVKLGYGIKKIGKGCRLSEIQRRRPGYGFRR